MIAGSHLGRGHPGRPADRWTRRRVWPDAGGLTVELIDPRGWLRAGWRRPDGAIVVTDVGTDAHLVGLTTVMVAAGGPARIVGHRLGRRAVVRGDDRWTKLLRVRRVARAATRHRAVAAIVAGGPLAVPEVLEVDEHRGALVLGHLAGRPFLEHPDPVGAAGQVAAAIGEWRHHPVPDLLGTHDAAAERRVLDRWAAHATDHGLIPTASRAAFDRAVVAAGEELVALGPRPRQLSHRDLHDGQVLVSEQGVGVLDLDTATAADPALDLGNLWAHVDLAAASGRIDPAIAEAVGAALVEGWGLAHDTAAVAAYRRASRLRLVAVHAFRPKTAVPARLLLEPSPRR